MRFLGNLWASLCAHIAFHKLPSWLWVLYSVCAVFFKISSETCCYSDNASSPCWNYTRGLGNTHMKWHGTPPDLSCSSPFSAPSIKVTAGPAWVGPPFFPQTTRIGISNQYSEHYELNVSNMGRILAANFLSGYCGIMNFAISRLKQFLPVAFHFE